MKRGMRKMGNGKDMQGKGKKRKYEKKKAINRQKSCNKVFLLK
jgi:hypothetical protein